MKKGYLEVYKSQTITLTYPAACEAIARVLIDNTNETRVSSLSYKIADALGLESDFGKAKY